MNRSAISHGRPGRRFAGEDGTITLWLLGLSLLLLVLGGFAVDLWLVLEERRALAGAAETAVIAGSSGLDLVSLRAAAEPEDGASLRLDPQVATALAVDALEAQAETHSMTGYDVDVDTDQIVVTVRGEVPFRFFRLLPGEVGDSFELEVSAVAEPRVGR